MKNEEKFGIQYFDKKNIVIKKAGKTINVYDMIQAGREDTEIIPTLEKYGSIERMEKPGEEIFQDFEELTDLRTVIEKTERAKEQWYNLPEKIRQIFNNNVDEYVENGMSWAEKMKQRIQEDTKKSDDEKLKNKIKQQEQFKKEVLKEMEEEK